MKTNLFLLFILLLLNLPGFSQKPDLKDWKRDSLPGPSSIKLEILNRSKDNWKFKVVGKKTKIIKNNLNYFKGDKLPFSKKFITTNLPKLYEVRAAKKVDGGYIVGLNNGEFGGGLWFVSKDGRTSYCMVNYLRIVEIFEYDSRLFAIEGLSHLGISKGNLIEIYKDGDWKYRIIKRLPSAPISIEKYKDHFVIVGYGSLIKLDENLEVTTPLKSPFYWGMLYPSSIVFENEDIYLAMRGGILKIKDFETKPKYEWYVSRN